MTTFRQIPITKQTQSLAAAGAAAGAAVCGEAGEATPRRPEPPSATTSRPLVVVMGVTMPGAPRRVTCRASSGVARRGMGVAVPRCARRAIDRLRHIVVVFRKLASLWF